MRGCHYEEMGDHKLDSDHGTSGNNPYGMRVAFHCYSDVLVGTEIPTRRSIGYHSIVTERLPFCRTSRCECLTKDYSASVNLQDHDSSTTMPSAHRPKTHRRSLWSMLRRSQDRVLRCPLRRIQVRLCEFRKSKPLAV